MDERPAQDSILFHCWWLWRIYQLGPDNSQRIAAFYIARLIAERERD